MNIYLENIAKMLAHAKLCGRYGIEIHANKKTRDVIRQAHEQQQRDTRSPMERFFNRRMAGDELVLFGVPVIENPKCKDEFVALRLDGTAGNPNWFEEMMADEKGSGNPAAWDAPPWHEKAPAAQDTSADSPVRLDALSGATGRVSASDVLMKAFEGIDDVNDIIVIRVHKNGDATMSATMAKTAAAGYLQKVYHNVMMM